MEYVSHLQSFIPNVIHTRSNNFRTVYAPSKFDLPSQSNIKDKRTSFDESLSFSLPIEIVNKSATMAVNSVLQSLKTR